MWPWEHAAVAYLLYSFARRATGRAPPTENATVALCVAAVLPDLVDKPLSWGLGWFPSGYAVAHSLLVAVPLGVAALAAGRRRDCPRVGVAFAVGYWSHLLGDILNPVRTGLPPDVDRVLWPFVHTEPYAVDRGLGRGVVYVREFVTAVSAMPPLEVFLLYVLFPLAAVAVWALDGAPGTGVPRRLHAAIQRRLP